MSFARLRRELRDDVRAPGRRFVALRRAVGAFASLTRTSFQSVWSQLAARHALSTGTVSDGEALVRAFEDLERARSTFLEQLERYSRMRRSEKQRGLRVPPPGTARALYASVTLGVPLRTSPARDGQG